MNYPCPNCHFGTLKPSKITYTRRWGPQLIVLPNFDAWRCDSCGFTRYDASALAHVRLLLGPEEDEWAEPYHYRSQPAEGPDEAGPRRWSS